MIRLIRRLACLSLLALSVAPVLAACAPSHDDTDAVDEAPITTASAAELSAAQATDISGFTFENLTPAGTKIMHASHYWMGAQDESPRYPRPHMCASNVSKVFFLSGITRYDQEGVYELLHKVSGSGGTSYKMPQAKADFIAKLNAIHGGHLPAGTLLAGMNVHSSNPGDQHIAFIGHVDPDGTVWAYHNNWYRPENEGGQRKPYMISDENLRRGFLRQWMATPWLKLTRDASGKIVDAVDVVPAIDDMNPFNPDYQVTLMVPAEIEQDVAAN